MSVINIIIIIIIFIISEEFTKTFLSSVCTGNPGRSEKDIARIP